MQNEKNTTKAIERIRNAYKEKEKLEKFKEKGFTRSERSKKKDKKTNEKYTFELFDLIHCIIENKQN